MLLTKSLDTVKAIKLIGLFYMKFSAKLNELSLFF